MHIYQTGTFAELAVYPVSGVLPACVGKGICVMCVNLMAVLSCVPLFSISLVLWSEWLVADPWVYMISQEIITPLLPPPAVVSIEDPFDQDDWPAWSQFTASVGIQVSECKMCNTIWDLCVNLVAFPFWYYLEKNRNRFTESRFTTKVNTSCSVQTWYCGCEWDNSGTCDVFAGGWRRSHGH